MALYIGHVNGTFPERSVTSQNAAKLLDCPFNYKHKIAFEDFFQHLDRCPEEAKKDIVECCEHNLVHFFPALDVEREIHLKICPNRNQSILRERKIAKKPRKEFVPLPPLRERVGIENPRYPQPPISDIREVLGPDVRFPELEQTADERRKKAEDRGDFTYKGLNAYEDVLAYGPGHYGQYAKFTSHMSRSEKIKFARFLDAENEKRDRATYIDRIFNRAHRTWEN